MKKYFIIFLMGIVFTLLPIIILIVIVGGSMSSASESLADDYMTAADAVGGSWQEMMAFDLVRYENSFDDVNPYMTAMEFAILYIDTGAEHEKVIQTKKTPEEIRAALGLSENDDLEYVMEAIDNNPMYSLSSKSLEDVMTNFSFSDEEKEYMGELLIGGILSEQYGDTLSGHIDVEYHGYFPWPTPSFVPESITSSYGYRTHPVTHLKTFHYGLDIACSEGTPVISIVEDGKVHSCGYTDDTGYYVIVDATDEKNDYSWRIKYYHLKEIKCKQGDNLQQGDIIALSGNTGISTGPHLHIETICNGVYQDPLPLLRGE